MITPRLLIPGFTSAILTLFFTLLLTGCSTEDPVNTDGTINSGIDTRDSVVISGVDSASVIEDVDPNNDGLLEASGKLNITDNYSGEAAFIAATHDGNYGTLTIDSSGNWTYLADNNHTTVQSISSGETLTDSLTVSSIGGTTHIVVITIRGADEVSIPPGGNNAALISGADSGSVVEDVDPDGDNLLEVDGKLNITDSDPGEAAFIAETINGIYGGLTINSAGYWSYAANNTQNVIQNLNNNITLTDSMTVSSIDGTTHTIEITIIGVDEIPVPAELVISSHTPSVDAVDISLSPTISVLFNTVLDESTINATSVKLLDASNSSVVTDISHNNGSLIITPVSTLDPLSQYTVILLDTIKGIDNNALTQAYSWSFITVSNTTPTTGFCDPLPPATGSIITVDTSQASNLDTIVSSLKTGETLLLEDGIYSLNGVSLRFNTPGVTLRSASGNPDNVILDGGYITNEIVSIAASNVTIAGISIKRAYTHPIHVTTSDAGNTVNTLIYRTNIIDAREQAIKINPGYNSNFVDSGTVACSSLLLTDTGRQNINNIATPCYTGGIDAHTARDWIIRDNRIEGYWCPTGLAQHAINFWTNSRDTVVKRNVLVNNARGIGLGLVDNGSSPRIYPDSPCPQAAGEYVSHYGGLIKNNFVFTSSPDLLNSDDGVDCAICLWSACEVTVVHNSVFSTGSNLSSIEMRFSSTRDTRIYNNLVSHSIRIRDNASGDIQGNLENASGALFVGGGVNEDLHLSPGATTAIDQGYSSINNIDIDIDGNARDTLPDIGADEVAR